MRILGATHPDGAQVAAMATGSDLLAKAEGTDGSGSNRKVLQTMVSLQMEEKESTKPSAAAASGRATLFKISTQVEPPKEGKDDWESSESSEGFPL